MSTVAPTPWNEAVVYAACGTGLLPLTYARPEDDDLREGRRPHLQDIDLVARRLAVTGTSVRLSRRTRELLGVARAEPLLGQGVYPELGSEMLGHATVAITLDLYSHATPATHREAARVLDTLPRPQQKLAGVNLGVKTPAKGLRHIRSPGAQEGTRTLTTLRSPAPQAGVSTNSTTWARGRRILRDAPPPDGPVGLPCAI